MQFSPWEIKSLLAFPFLTNQVKWRAQSAGVKRSGEGAWVRIVPYVSATDVSHRLDSVMGIDHWRVTFERSSSSPVSTICTLSLLFGDHWVVKQDAAPDTDIEAVKGGISDSFKRAAVHWGVARCLYNTGTLWGDVSDAGAYDAKLKNPGGADQWIKWNPPKHWPPSMVPEPYQVACLLLLDCLTLDQVVKMAERIEQRHAEGTVSVEQKAFFRRVMQCQLKRLEIALDNPSESSSSVVRTVI